MNMRHIMRCALAVAALFALIAAAEPASASLLITVDKSTQRMSVAQDGVELYNWPVSTGVRGRDTPSGEFKPFRMEKDHFSREWDDAPMPNSIFFTMQGHAIHGSSHTKYIGRPASHGCVRLEPRNAETLWHLVKHEKMANTRVVLTGETPGADPALPVARAPIAAPEPADFTASLPDRRAPRVQAERDDGPAFFDGRNYYDRRGRRYIVVGRDDHGGVRLMPEDSAQAYPRPQQHFYRDNWN
jgi:hypothetical protein